MKSRNMIIAASKVAHLVTVAGFVVLGTIVAPTAQAKCGSADDPALARILSMYAPMSAAAQTPPMQDQQFPPGLQDDSPANPSIVGFWKTTFVSGTTLVDVGFDQFHSDGMENSVDSPPPSFGNVCLGIWEKTGPKRYSEVHPSFNWDASGNVISIFVQRVDIILSRDGKSFQGTFTWDSYDFKGNSVEGSHVAGTVTGERITLRAALPFPFPF